jgi:ATP-dependent protease HslVU (ClpYQ) peptidase subunit
MWILSRNCNRSLADFNGSLADFYGSLANFNGSLANFNGSLAAQIKDHHVFREYHNRR